MSIIPDDDYSPYDFIFVLTGVFGVISVVGPLLVPRGPDRGLERPYSTFLESSSFIRISIILSSFFMWLAWVTVYISQVHPISGLRFKHSTLVWISYSWGNAKGIKPIILPTTTTKPKPKPATKTTVSKVSTQSTTMPIPEELRSKKPRSTKATTKRTTPSTTTGTTASTTTAYAGSYLGGIYTEWGSYLIFRINSLEGDKGFLEFIVRKDRSQPINDEIGPRLLLTGEPPNAGYPMVEIAFHCGASKGDLYISIKNRRNKKIRRFSKSIKETSYRVEWNGKDITFYKLPASGSNYTYLFTWTNPDPFVIKYAGICGRSWNMKNGFGLVHPIVWHEPYYKPNRNDDLRANFPVTTNKISLRTGTDFLFASTRYTFYKVTMEPISFSVLAELDEYRDFFILLSATDSRSVPRIVINIVGENGRKCTISKNGIISVYENCKTDWRKNTYLPFYIWYKNGNIEVKSGYDGAVHSKRVIHWNDPDPFNVNYYGLRSSRDDKIHILVKNVEDDDWERLYV